MSIIAKIEPGSYNLVKEYILNFTSESFLFNVESIGNVNFDLVEYTIII